MLESTTIEHVGKMLVQVRMTDADKQLYTMMMAITADSRKLPPFVIFRKKKFPNDKFLPGITVKVPGEGWITEKLILEWVNMVWKRQLEALLHKHTMLILDNFCGHKTERVKAKVNDDTDLLVMSGGITKLLQLLDVVFYQPFKGTFWQLYNQWMITTKHVLRTSRRNKHMPLPTVCEWNLAPQLLQKL
jgi:hypothetical protein